MARYTETTPLRASDLRRYAEALRKIAAANDELADAMDENGIDKLISTHLKTAENSLEGLARFLGAVMQARIAAVGEAAISEVMAIETLRREVAGTGIANIAHFSDKDYAALVSTPGVAERLQKIRKKHGISDPAAISKDVREFRIKGTQKKNATKKVDK